MPEKLSQHARLRFDSGSHTSIISLPFDTDNQTSMSLPSSPSIIQNANENKMTDNSNLADMTESLAQITKLRQAQNKTLEMYKELYESYIESPNKSYDRSKYRDPTLNLSNFLADETNNITSLADETSNITSLIEQNSTASTVDISRLKSNNTTVSEMWNGFTVDTYAPREKSKPKDNRVKPKLTPTVSRVTVPDPFYMTLRDELKRPMKTKAQEEIEQRRKQRIEDEEKECSKQFKASPIPPSTSRPRLKKIQSKQEIRRATVKAMSKELTAALQQPFSFSKKECLRRSRSLSSLDHESKKIKEEKQFFAKPMPRYIFDPQVAEKQKEEEQYRQIRIKMRAEQMLADSQLPQNMKRHALHYTDGRIRRAIVEDNAKRAHLTEEHTFNPAIKDYVPNYEVLHQQNEAELLARQAIRPVTTVEPFYLRTEELAKQRAVDRTPPSSPNYSSKPVKRSPCPYKQVYPEMINNKPTVASNLRDSATRKKIIADKKVKQAEYESEINQKLKELALRKSVVIKSKALDPSYRDTIDTKVREKIEQQKRMEIEYQTQLDVMNDKLRDRPFLFERQSTSSARKSTEKSFRRALEAAGIDESLIQDISKFEQDSLMIS